MYIQSYDETLAFFLPCNQGVPQMMVLHELFSSVNMVSKEPFQTDTFWYMIC